MLLKVAMAAVSRHILMKPVTQYKVILTGFNVSQSLSLNPNTVYHYPVDLAQGVNIHQRVFI